MSFIILPFPSVTTPTRLSRLASSYHQWLSDVPLFKNIIHHQLRQHQNCSNTPPVHHGCAIFRKITGISHNHTEVESIITKPVWKITNFPTYMRCAFKDEMPVSSSVINSYRSQARRWLAYSQIIHFSEDHESSICGACGRGRMIFSGSNVTTSCGTTREPTCNHSRNHWTDDSRIPSVSRWFYQPARQSNLAWFQHLTIIVTEPMNCFRTSTNRNANY